MCWVDFEFNFRFKWKHVWKSWTWMSLTKLDHITLLTFKEMHFHCYKNFFHDYWINILGFYSRKITSEIYKVIFLPMRLITPAVLRVRVSAKGWLQQTKDFILLSFKQIVFLRNKIKLNIFSHDIPKIKMKREN